jgi:hypothetical protein
MMMASVTMYRIRMGAEENIEKTLVADVGKEQECGRRVEGQRMATASVPPMEKRRKKLEKCMY